MLYFLCLLCNLRDCFYRYVVSSVYHVNCMLIFRVFHERGNFCRVLCDLGVFQVLLDVLSLVKLEGFSISSCIFC